MPNFEERYRKYRQLLAQLDHTENIAEKNMLFRQLSGHLVEMEQELRRPASQGVPPGRGGQDDTGGARC